MSTEKHQQPKTEKKASFLKRAIGKFRVFFMTYEKEIVFFVALILVSVFSFEVGMMKAQDTSSGVLVIERPVGSDVAGVDIQEEHEIQERTSVEAQVAGAETVALQEDKKCMFVGSKNSDKYHSLSCHWADRIKEENRVCFSSVDDAKKRGYKEGCIE